MRVGERVAKLLDSLELQRSGKVWHGFASIMDDLLGERETA